VLYQRSLSVPANTSSAAPVETTIVVKHPVVTRLGVRFPRGCAGMVEAAVFYGKLQIWPAKEGEWASGDDVTIWDEPFFELPDRETTLTLKGCSPNTSYEHTLRFYIIALSRAVALWMTAIARFVRLLESIIERLIGIPIPAK